MIPRGNSFIIELTYQKKEEKEPVLLDRDEGAFIDLGVNNFAAIDQIRRKADFGQERIFEVDKSKL